MNPAAQRIAALRASRFFDAFPDEVLGVLAPLLRDLSVGPGELVIREGEPAREVFVIADGEVAVIKNDSIDGTPREIVVFNAGVALYAANVAGSIGDGIARARSALASGAAKRKLAEFVDATRKLAA